jgi:hypothetical protein
MAGDADATSCPRILGVFRSNEIVQVCSLREFRDVIAIADALQELTLIGSSAATSLHFLTMYAMNQKV